MKSNLRLSFHQNNLSIQITGRSRGCIRVRLITNASIKTMSLNDSRAFTKILSNCLTSWSVTLLLIQPYTISALGCNAEK